MGSTCSSKHKGKDTASQRSEESPSYQITKGTKSDSIELPTRTTVASGVVLKVEPNDGQSNNNRNQIGCSGSSNPLTKPTSNPSHKTVGRSSFSTESVSPGSPPHGSLLSPKEVNKSLLPPIVRKLPNNLQNLLVGLISASKTNIKTRKIVLYVSAADSQDCCVEKGILHNQVYPNLRLEALEKGYELHIIDLHWKTGLEKQQDHEFPELCIEQLNRQSEVAYIIPVLFLSNSLGTPLLPKTIESQDFEVVLSKAGDRQLLEKWYQLDGHAQPPCYRLKPITSNIPGFKEGQPEERENALQIWRSEIDRVLTVLIDAFSEELRDLYLTTVVEQEVHNTVMMSQELAKRCLWLYRVYTHQTEDNKAPLSLGDGELKRRLDSLQKNLRAQLNEQNILRMPVQWMEGGLNAEFPEHAQYMASVQSQLIKLLSSSINTIIEEDQTKAVLKPCYGVESSLLNELVEQTHFTQRASQCSISKDDFLNIIKSYIMGETASEKVLVLHGNHGCGKTTLLARAAQYCHCWSPDCALAVRFVGTSQQSMTLEQILRTIITQFSIISDGNTPYIENSLQNYSDVLLSTLTSAALQRTLVIIIDGLDQIREYGKINFDWLPVTVPNNVRIIVSVNEEDDFNKIDAFTKLKNRLGTAGSYLVQMPILEKSEAESLFLSSIMENNLSLSNNVEYSVRNSIKECTLPLYVKVLAWHTSWNCEMENEVVPTGDVEKQLMLMFDQLEALLGKEQVSLAMALMMASKYALLDSEMLDLLAYEPQFHSKTTYAIWAPACLFWAQFVKQLVPFLFWLKVGTSLALHWRDAIVRSLIKKRYQSHISRAHKILFEYFKGQLWSSSGEHVAARQLVQSNKAEKGCYNCRRLEELPFQAYKHNTNFINDYLFDQNWVYDKLCGSTVYQVLEDVSLAPCDPAIASDITWLQKFLEFNSSALAYDGRQLYSLLSIRKKHNSPSSQLCVKWNRVASNPPVSCLTVIPSNDTNISGDSEIENKTIGNGFNSIVRIPNNPNYIVTISTEKEEVAVWDIHRVAQVRTLKGIMQPISLKMIDDYRCVVLCQRELRTYDLNSGTLLTRLKGVMNQKMPFFGLHDSNHLVALSRNRMYVNLMNLTTGDLVTTFKAGEDRFLNSLLVSGNGKLLVCGDETQKPFPLLVWNLASRKLLYDLRIPHHDFLTHLSAITYEGNYVCCVTKEVDDPAPNFIVVYDLQSGTLFKKWKPGTNCLSLDISSKDGCILSGHEDGRILIWDLVTGNCRCKLYGHSGPVSCLRLDPLGGSFVSYDSECSDRSIRLWNITKCELSAVFTPDEHLTACEITAGGEFVIVATKNTSQITTLKLVGANITKKSETNSVGTYGLSENTGKVFSLQDR